MNYGYQMIAFVGFALVQATLSAPTNELLERLGGQALGEQLKEAINEDTITFEIPDFDYFYGYMGWTNAVATVVIPEGSVRVTTAPGNEVGVSCPDAAVTVTGNFYEKVNDRRTTVPNAIVSGGLTDFHLRVGATDSSDDQGGILWNAQITYESHFARKELRDPPGISGLGSLISREMAKTYMDLVGNAVVKKVEELLNA